MDLQEQYEKLLRYCYLLTKDRNTAEDAVQETFLRFWQSRTYRDTGRETAYLYAIARNLCMDEFRRVRPDDLEQYGETLGDETAGPDRELTRIAVQTALEKLPPELRELVVLRYTNEMSVTDIAKVVGLSRFAVHRRLKEGLSRLRNELGDETGE